MKIALLGCKGTTLDLLHDIHSEVPIDTVITLPKDIAAKNNVAFYRTEDIIKFCEKKNIPHQLAESYNLKSESDQNFFERSNFDLLLVIGWERLIPEMVLKTLNKFSCGMHGSAFGLPRGRGRSPMNWALITNQKFFTTYLFRYKPGIDDGDIIGFQSFEITQHDSIETLHLKNRIVMGNLVKEYFPLIAEGKEVYFPQPPENTTFYPKRKPGDGIIDWRKRTETIYNLIRAVSTPYPSAFSFLYDKKVVIHGAIPFDNLMYSSKIEPGQVLNVSPASNFFIVKTLDGSLLINDFEGYDINDIEPGMKFSSGDQDEIMEDILTRYPDFVSEDQMEIDKRTIQRLS